MNERIKELAVQAGLEMCSCGCDMPTRQSVKFAELIVKECSKILRNGAYWSGPNGFVRDCTAAEMASSIEEHFGVE